LKETSQNHTKVYRTAKAMNGMLARRLRGFEADDYKKS
jgi:hypothetical protein